MNIEETIFQRSLVDFNKLTKYGFKEFDAQWIYTKEFMNGAFRAVVTIDKKGTVSGNVYETEIDDVFLPLRVESMGGEYVAKVRLEYEQILQDIKAHCFTTQYFNHPQTNRLANALTSKYKDMPLFPWKEYPGFGVFKNPDTDKWYALFMNIDKSKLDPKQSGKVEALNIKLAPEEILVLLKQKGFYPAYHMNKKSWISIVLNDTLNDNVILDLINKSYAYSVKKRKKTR